MRGISLGLGLGFAGFLCAASGCEERGDPMLETDLEDDAATLCEIPSIVTYSEDAKAAFDRGCASCHSTGRSGSERNGAPASVNFDSYDDAVDSAYTASQRVEDGVMPPNGSLNACDEQIIQKWVQDGTQQ